MPLTETTLTTPSPSWRQRYWRLCGRGRKALRDRTMARRLKELRRRALAAPRFEPGCLSIDGYRIHYDDLLSLYHAYKHIFAWGIYDFRPRDDTPLVLDCGSHIGLSILRFKQIAPGCRVIGFEPDARARDLLHHNLAANRLRNVEIVSGALATARGTLQFVADGGAAARESRAGAAVERVDSVPLSDYLDEPVDLLKMNIEGAEYGVLHEAAGRLHNVRQIVVEYHGFPECGQTLHGILRLLHECGFRYVLHHFDYETNPALRPPLHVAPDTRYFQLIAATRLWNRRPKPGATSAGEAGGAARGAADLVPSCEPTSRKFGFDRGQPIDRTYIAAFLQGHQRDIQGRVLEVGDAEYTRRFGGRRVLQADVLNPVDAPGTTIRADLARADGIPDGTFDCFILTQTLPFIFDVRAALRHAHRILKPGGVLLLTTPCISQISRYDADRWGDFWRFTPQAVKRLLGDVFGAENVTLTVYGNMRVAAAFLDGQATEELTPDTLQHVDADYPLIVAARAARAAQPAGTGPVGNGNG